jgi:hypothetical protein
MRWLAPPLLPVFPVAMAWLLSTAACVPIRDDWILPGVPESVEMGSPTAARYRDDTMGTARWIHARVDVRSRLSRGNQIDELRQTALSGGQPGNLLLRFARHGRSRGSRHTVDFLGTVEFVSGDRTQVKALGAGASAVYVEHPIQDWTDDGMQVVADDEVPGIVAILIVNGDRTRDRFVRVMGVGCCGCTSCCCLPIACVSFKS